MTASAIGAALQRAETVLTQKPALALQTDTPATAVRVDGLAFELHHPNGQTVRTDLATTLGGAGSGFQPGWLMRAGLASCTATLIAMRAERLGITLGKLEVTARSESDVRGLLGIDPSVIAGPSRIDMDVEIEAEGVADSVLAELVAWADAHSPVGNVVRRNIETQMNVNVAHAAAH
jgi:uncharacterized OsmC-like protein